MKPTKKPAPTVTSLTCDLHRGRVRVHVIFRDGRIETIKPKADRIAAFARGLLTLCNQVTP